MKLILFIFCLSLLTQAFAGTEPVKETTKGNRTERSYDFNDDGKVDAIIVSVDKQIREEKEDLDFDGTFDRITTFAIAEGEEFSKVVELRAFGDTKRSRTSYWSDENLKLTFSRIQVDNNNDGTWDTTVQNHAPLRQHDENCQQQDKQAYTGIAGVVLKAAEASNEYDKTASGYRVHKSCTENDPQGWFLKTAEASIKEGLACMDKLAKAGGQGAAKNSASLKTMLKDTGVQILCNETNYDWGNGGTGTVHGHATTGPGSNAPLYHPGISLNPKIVKNTRGKGKIPTNEFKRTIFHEQLHNLGYRHNVDIEFPYTCGVCCFPDPDHKILNVVAPACKVCSGNFSSFSDPKYVEAITEYAKASSDRARAFSATENFLYLNPGNMDGLSWLAVNTSGYYDTVGGEIAELLSAESGLSKKQKANFKFAGQHKSKPLHESYKDSSRLIAASLITSFRGQPLAAFKGLAGQVATIKAQLAGGTKNAEETFVRENLREKVKAMVIAVTLDHKYGVNTSEKEKEELKVHIAKVRAELGI